ncbi:dicarboxylate/amino acid:cation symporter [Duganella sp. Root198D2]|uniref:dicarboxylate/amino acid:cation symporter n=1 Tax=Duganella sp. Root198D2 TaxID=1736489 RepID=UPI00070DFE3E|nr:cation:dicarboxylase symporter family transporter [Duganella sp. Root198D2]KRB92484.1 sodium:dicarboxylate symporter [Duganella sp. Root198D2]
MSSLVQPAGAPPAAAWRRVQSLATNPLVVLACVLLGGTIGWSAPAIGQRLALVGAIYVNLLTMVVLPFMISAVVLSLQTLYREGGTSRIAQRVVAVFVLLALAAAMLATAGTLAMHPGDNLSDATRLELGQIVGGAADQTNTAMALRQPDSPPATVNAQEIVRRLVPSNIFAALAEGETLKVLIFALLFGMSVGQVPERIAGGLQQALQSVYEACQTLTRWINLPLPLVVVCMTAGQVAHTGVAAMAAMAGYVVSFLFASVLVICLALLLLRQRAGGELQPVLKAMREPFALGVATNSSAACMPAMVQALAGPLGFARTRVELLVPLCTALLRAGPVVYFVSGTMFIAALYGRTLGGGELALLAAVAALTGFASSGMGGVATVGLMGTVCACLSLPFEAAFVLFVAVDPLCAMARTAVSVLVSCAAVSLICARPLSL